MPNELRLRLATYSLWEPTAHKSIPDQWDLTGIIFTPLEERTEAHEDAMNLHGLAGVPTVTKWSHEHRAALTLHREDVREHSRASASDLNAGVMRSTRQKAVASSTPEAEIVSIPTQNPSSSSNSGQ